MRSSKEGDLTFGAKLAWSLVWLFLGIAVVMLIGAALIQLCVNEMQAIDATITYGDALRGALLIWIAGRLFNWGT